MSRLWLALVFSAVAAACSGPAAEVGRESIVAEADPVIGSTPPTSTPAGVVIPNISLTLADGSIFDFAEVDTPVMLVFWAEW